MKISLDVRKTVDQNAAAYFEAAKKARSKIAGARKAIAMAVEKRKAAEDAPTAVVEKQLPKKVRKRAWFEKFKWFVASNGMLVIAGRDATTNELAIRKHVDKHDVIFHTDAAGSPFVVLKTEGVVVPENVLQEVTDFCGAHSKAWKLGLATAEVYWVTPEQVTKEAKAGEFMGKGSFMVYGKRNFMHPKMGLVAIPFEDKVMVAPPAAAQAHFTGEAAIVSQGTMKASDAAKKIISIIGVGEPDDVLPGLPSGGCKVEKFVLE